MAIRRWSRSGARQPDVYLGLRSDHPTAGIGDNGADANASCRLAGHCPTRSCSQRRAAACVVDSSGNLEPDRNGAHGFAHSQGSAGPDQSRPSSAVSADRHLASSGRRDKPARRIGMDQPAAAGMTRNPLAWCAWMIAALAGTFMDRNPWLQGLLLLILINVWLPYRRGRPLHLRLGLMLSAIPIVFSVALSRFGEHVIVTLPTIPIIGGRWTWEAALFGASSGAALLLTVIVFTVLQSTVHSADLISLLPPPLYRAGTAFALAVTFAPKTVASFHAITEARQLRGRRSGWRAAPSVLLPLLLTALEQALQYGESLDARGYGTGQRSRYRPIAWAAL